MLDALQTTHRMKSDTHPSVRPLPTPVSESPPYEDVCVDADDATFHTAFKATFSPSVTPTLEWIGINAGHAETMKHIIGFLCAMDQYCLMQTSMKWHKALRNSPAVACILQRRAMDRIKRQEGEHAAAPLWSDPRCKCTWFVQLCRPYGHICEETTVFHSPIFTVSVKTITGKLEYLYFASADTRRPVLPQVTVAMVYELISHSVGFDVRGDGHTFPFAFFLHVGTRILHHLDASLASYIRPTRVPSVRLDMVYGSCRSFDCVRANQSVWEMATCGYPFVITDVVQPPDQMVAWSDTNLKHPSRHCCRLLQHGRDRVYCIVPTSI